MKRRAADVAEEAVAASAAVLAERYRGLDTTLDADFSPTDVKAAADVAAEEAILPVLREAFPGHAVYAEESGHHEPVREDEAGGRGDGEADDGADARYRWIVDPLDGTNNFAAGLPTFATAVALERLPPVGAESADGDGGAVADAPPPADGLDERGEPLVAAAALPATGESYLAVRGEGLRYEGARVRTASERALGSATVVTVIGRPVFSDEALSARAEALFGPVSGAAKRRLDTWAPVVHWGLLGRGLVDAVVAFHPDAEEQVFGELVARESGAAVWREGDLYVAAASEALRNGVVDLLAT